MKGKKEMCYNCKHGGEPFKIGGKTHLHCHHPKHTVDTSPWDTLMEFWEKCSDFKLTEGKALALMEDEEMICMTCKDELSTTNNGMRVAEDLYQCEDCHFIEFGYRIWPILLIFQDD